LVSENLKDNVDIDKTWESVRDIKTSAKEYSTYYNEGGMNNGSTKGA
jgi:hypothetical protein